MYIASMGNGSRIKSNQGVEGETIERKFERILNNKEPIKGDGVPLIHTERKDGVQPAYNIRTDRFEIAVLGMDKIDKSIKAKREEKAKSFEMKIVGDESTDGTGLENQS